MNFFHIPSYFQKLNSRQRTALLLGVFMVAAFCLATFTQSSYAQPPGSLLPLQQQVAFGQLDYHTGGAPQQSIQFFNSSPSTIDILKVRVTESSNNSSFSISEDNCSGGFLLPSTSCSVSVSFSAEAGAPNTFETANLEVQYTAQEPPLLEEPPHLEESAVQSDIIPLSGEGVTGILTAAPEKLVFAPIPYSTHGGEESSSENEEITITDTAFSANISNAYITGPDASSYSIQNEDCKNADMRSGNTCVISIRFQPKEPGQLDATLTVVSDATNSSFTIPLEGKGLHGPKLSVNTKQALLGNVVLGASASETFVITDTGDYPLYIQQDFLVSGTPDMFPVTEDTCSGFQIPPEKSCHITVVFKPTTLGEKDGALLVAGNVSPITVLGIDGVGVAPPSTSPAFVSPPTLLSQPPSASSPSSGIWLSLLTPKMPAHITNVHGKKSFVAGTVAHCPLHNSCQVEAYATTYVPSSSIGVTGGVGDNNIVMLAHSRLKVAEGDSMNVILTPSHHALTLFKKNKSTRVSTETAFLIDGKVVAKLISSETVLSH